MKLRFCGCELDTDLRELRRGGDRVPVRPQILRFLELLIDHEGCPVSRAQIEKAVWGRVRVSKGSLANLVFEARRTIGDDGRAQSSIRTVRGVGVRFVAPVVRDHDRLPAWVDREDQDSGSFVGREIALARLRGELERCLGGQARIVLVAGEPGIGKTRLVEEFASRLDPAHVDLALGHCIEAEAAPSFWPWLQVLRRITSKIDRETLRELVGTQATEIERMIGEGEPEAASAPLGEAASDRFRRFQAVARLLAAQSRRKPLVLVIEDLHRADAASLELLEFVADAAEQAPLLLVATCRPAEPGRATRFQEILARLTRLENAGVEALEPLDVEDLPPLVTALTGRSPSPAVVRQLHLHTGGNPFFVHQVARTLMAHSEAHDSEGEIDLVAMLGPGVRAAILQHVAGLPNGCRKLLAQLSVAGRRFEVKLVELLFDGPSPDLESLLRAAVDARVIVREGEEYRFSHVLIRDALYEGLDLASRSEMHARLGAALERLYGSSAGPQTARIAHHYEAVTGEGFGDQAIHHLVEAARVATTRLAYEDALEHQERALRALDRHRPQDERRRCELLIGLGEARTRANDRPGGAAAFRQAVELARRCNDGTLEARAALGYSPGLQALEVGIVDPFLIETLEHALGLLGPAPTQLRARLLARLAMAIQWTPKPEPRFDLCAEAVHDAEQSGDAGTFAFVLTARVAALWSPDDAEARLAEIARALDLARQARDRETELVCLLHRATTLLALGRFGTAGADMASFADRARALRQPHSLWFVDLFRAQQAITRGDFDAADKWVEAFGAEGRKAGDINAAMCQLAVRSICLSERGEHEQAMRALRLLELDNPDTSATQRAIMALYTALAGDHATARTDLRRQASEGFRNIPRNLMWIMTIAVLAETAAILEEAPSAAELYDLLLPFDHQFVVMGYSVVLWRPVSYLLGRLAATRGDRQRACAHLRDAIEDCQRAGMVELAGASSSLAQSCARSSA